MFGFNRLQPHGFSVSFITTTSLISISSNSKDSIAGHLSQAADSAASAPVIAAPPVAPEAANGEPDHIWVAEEGQPSNGDMGSSRFTVTLKS